VLRRNFALGTTRLADISKQDIARPSEKSLGNDKRACCCEERLVELLELASAALATELCAN
jgi:hypothetical protein